MTLTCSDHTRISVSGMTIMFILRRKIRLRPVSYHYRPSEARAEMRAANQYYAQEMNIITIITHFLYVYKNNNVHFKGVRFICGPHLAIVGPSEARAELMTR